MGRGTAILVRVGNAQILTRTATTHTAIRVKAEGDAHDNHPIRAGDDRRADPQLEVSVVPKIFEPVESISPVATAKYDGVVALESLVADLSFSARSRAGLSRRSARTLTNLLLPREHREGFERLFPYQSVTNQTNWRPNVGIPTPLQVAPFTTFGSYPLGWEENPEELTRL